MKKYHLINIFTIILFIVVATSLDPFKENYSTLSLTRSGYFLFLFMGVLAGIILAYETYLINNKKYAVLMFVSLFLGVIIPHDISYNLRGNLHLINAYIGFSMMMIITFSNIYKYSLVNNKKGRYIMYFTLICLSISVYLYLDNMCVNTISELIIMIVVQLDHLFMSL
ncbi:MAG: hypothetical protein Q4E33_02780 [Erysipelotrichaceae bacterium]|nr:hypothetical protein [Erysipelotrichaceae bacterium]